MPIKYVPKKRWEGKTEIVEMVAENIREKEDKQVKKKSSKK